MDPFKESQKFSDAARMKNPVAAENNQRSSAGRSSRFNWPSCCKITRAKDEKGGPTLSFLCVWDDTEERFGNQALQACISSRR